MRYLVREKVNGQVTAMDGETVDEEWVERYTEIDARRFFINLGGTETLRRDRDGSIICRSTSPDRKITRQVKFIPISEESDTHTYEDERNKGLSEGPVT